MNEGDYSIGLYVVTDDFFGNLLELADFSVMSALASYDFVPYPPEHRGVLVLSAKSSVTEVAEETGPGSVVIKSDVH